MKPPLSRLGLLSSLTVLLAMTLSGCAGTQRAPRADLLALGRNGSGEPCTASRTWGDPAAPDAFAASYYITCRNVAASRPLGALRVVEDSPEGTRPIDQAFDCGQDVAIEVAGLPARARRCTDRLLATETVRIDVPMGKTRLVADASPSLLGPLEEGIAIVAAGKSPNADPGRETKPSIDLAALPPSPGGAVAPTGGNGAFDPTVALAQGISLNRRGQHVDASRVLNDALSRLPADATPAIRAELLLEAGLADSNISFADSAKDHFDQADALIAANPDAAPPFVRRKRATYRVLDLINRLQYGDALSALQHLSTAQVAVDQPLMDPSIVRRLNQSGTSRGVANAIAVPDTAELSQIVLDAQVNWARSVALASLGDAAAATTALDASQRSYETLQRERVDQGQLLWLGARIERQRGRLAASRKDWPTALAAFDRALDLLRRSAIASAGTGNEPTIAEAQFERATVFAQSGASREAIRTEYASAVDALIAANTTGSALPNGISGYLDILIEEADTAPKPDTYERFFRALQAAGEPAVARQLGQLQNVVTADPELGAKVRDREEIEREITRLRYAIASAGQTPGTSATDLEKQRQDAESKLLALDASLNSNQRFRAVDDRPATIADIRGALQPSEGFLKISEINRRAFGIYINADKTYIYRIAGTEKALRDLDKLGADIRGSIDGKLDAGKLVPYNEGAAYVLFRLVTGPAREPLLQAKALVIDPAGPLENLPVGALVTAFDPKQTKTDPFDFSTTAFLAARMTISTAVSPRSFLVVRSLPASTALNPFLGLGEHQAPLAANDSDRPVSVGFGCSVPYAKLATLSREFKPISKTELDVAANALGDPGAPMIIDGDFNDTSIENRTDLANYQVLHFATHGLEEGQWGCAKSPPALVTSFGGNDSDGLLSFSEIAGLRLNANLVVLSACDTASGVKDEALARASGQEEAGSTLEGLVRAFLTANARAVLATYWQVSAEQESTDFIRTFYASARADSMGSALQAAQLQLMHNPAYSHPFYWAPYFIVGDSTKSMLSKPAPAAAPAPAAK